MEVLTEEDLVLDMLKNSEKRLTFAQKINGKIINVSWATYGYNMLKIGEAIMSPKYLNDFYPDRDYEDYELMGSEDKLEIRKCLGGLEAKFASYPTWTFFLSSLQIKALQKQANAIEKIITEVKKETYD